MNPRTLLAALLLAGAAPAAEGPPPLAPLPVQWSLMGNGGPEALPGRCDHGVDNQKSADGKTVYSVRCDNSVIPSFGGAHHTQRTTQYRGKRVRVSGWLMASGVEGVATPQYAHVPGAAGLWLVVGSARAGVRMDRMTNRAIKGTADWQQLDFVVDVPDDNGQMFIGFWMQGRGQVWARDFSIEEVPLTVAVNFLIDDPQRVVGPDLSLLATAAARPEDPFLPPPPKWLAMGAQGFELCDIGVDATVLNSGQRNLSIDCAISQTAVLRQAFEAAPFHGKRVRFSGWIRTEAFEPMPGGGGAPGGAGLLATLDPQQAPPLHANLSGTTEWQHRELVLDVPRNSRWILIGIAVSGKGQVWGRDFSFEEVPRNMPALPPVAIRQ